MFHVDERVRVLTLDGLRYGGPVRECTTTFLRIFDEHDQRDVVLALSQIARAEVTR